MKKMVINLLNVILVMGLLGTAFAQSKSDARRFLKQGDEAYNQGRFSEALTYYNKALEINKEQKNPEGTAVNLRKIGWASYKLGRFPVALKYFEEGLATGREQKIPQEIAGNLSGIGAIYRFLGRYDKALKCFEEALNINRELKRPGAVALTLSRMGWIYLELGRYDEALKYVEDALKIGRGINNQSIMALLLNNTGRAYLAVARYDEALRCYEEALKINRELKMASRVYVNLGDIGWVYFALRDYDKAEEFFEGAQKEDPRKVQYSDSKAGLIETCLRRGKYKEALKMLNEKTILWSTSQLTRTRYYTQKGFSLKGLNMLKDASGEFLEAISLIEEAWQRTEDETVGFFEARGRTRAYQGLVGALSERAIKGDKKDSRFRPYGKDLGSAAFYFSESTKARVFLEEIVRVQKGKQGAEIPETMREKLQDCTDQLVEIDANLEKGFVKGKKTYEWVEERKKWYISKLNRLIQELREKYPRYAFLYYPKPLPAESLPLRDDELMLEYSLGDESSYIFVVRKGGVKKIVKIPLGREILEEKVRSFMEPMETRQYSFSVKRGKELYDILLADALGDAKENERVIIISEGILGLLPFDALVVREGARLEDSIYVGDKHNIIYYQSAAVLALSRSIQAERAERPLFALGNPVFNSEDPRYIAWKNGNKEQVLVAGLDQYSFRALATGRGVDIIGKDDPKKELEYRPLPETEREVVEISRIMGVEPAPPDVLLSVMANETELRRVKLDHYRYIHFATHADLPGEVQGIYEPFILLGQVENRERDDGFLTLSEVLDLKLNADMVVLSACLTGRGKVMEGEGVINFARAFQHAGAQSVVVSLWEVSSNEAVDYMKTFYGHLKAGKGRAEALGLARKEMKAKYPNPFFWAVFILHGEG